MWKGFQQLLELVYPSDLYCLCCGDFIDRGSRYSLCGGCEQKLHWITEERCPKCGRRTEEYKLCFQCAETIRSFQRGFSCVTYGMLEKDMIHKLKYKNQAHMAKHMGKLMAERFAAENLSADFVLPVPMHRRKESERGYNQAALLAEAVSQESGIALLKKVLIRSRDTAPMTEVDRWEREENIKNAFTVCGESAKMICGTTLLLVDDVYTTGSTADQCSRQLREAGAETVYVLAFASGADRSTIEIA